jgi:hypothetical protein
MLDGRDLHAPSKSADLSAPIAAGETVTARSGGG